MSSTTITIILVVIVNALVITCLYYVRLTDTLRVGNEALLAQVNELIEENKRLKLQIQSVPKWEGKPIMPNENSK